MSLTYTEYTGNGATRNYAVPFPYLSPLHLKVKVNNVEAPFVLLDAGTIQLAVAAPAGQKVAIQRETPYNATLYTFSDASALPALDINAVFNQLLFVFQEGLEGRAFDVAVGPTGPQGPAGPAGPIGPIGPIGPPGTSGVQATNYGSLT